MQKTEAASSSILRGAIRYCVFVMVPIVIGAIAENANSQTIFKVNNTHNLNLDTSWTESDGGTTPPFLFSTDGTLWFGSGMGGDLSLNTGAGLTVGSLRVDNTEFGPTANHSVQIGGSPITINGIEGRGIYLQGTAGGTLTMIAGLNLGASQSWEAARDYTIAGAVQLGGNVLTFRQSGGTAFISGGFSGAGGITNDFSTSVTSLTGVNSYQGTTRINQGVLQVSGSGTLGGTAGSSNDTGNIVFGGASSNGTLRFDSAANLGVASQIRFGNTGGTAGSGGRLEYVGSTDQTINKTIHSDSSIGMRIASNSVGGSLTINGPFSQTNRSLYLEGTGTGNNTMAAVFSGTGVLHKRESGTWLLSNTNDYSGGTAISGGTLKVNALSGIGSGSLTIQDGSTFRYEGIGNESTTRELNLNSGASTIDVVQANASLAFSSGGTRNQAFTKAGAGHLSINGGFSGSASISVDGGTLQLTGSSDHSGTTTVKNAGVLVIDGSHSGGGAYDVQAGGKLMGSGSIGADVSVASGATLAAGNSIGTLDIVGNLTVGGAYEWELDSGSHIADLVDVRGNVDLTGASLNIVDLAIFLTGHDLNGQKFTLLSYSGTLTGTFSGFDTALWTIDYADSAAGVNGGSHANFVTLSAVPEPSALLFVGATVAVGFLRRRRSI